MKKIDIEGINTLILDINKVIDDRPDNFPVYSGFLAQVHKKTGWQKKQLKIKNEKTIQASLDAQILGNNDHLEFLFDEEVIERADHVDLMARFGTTPEKALQKYQSDFNRKHRHTPRYISQWSELRRFVKTEDKYIALEPDIFSYTIFMHGTFQMYDRQKTGITMMHTKFDMLTEDDQTAKSDAVEGLQNVISARLVGLFDDGLGSKQIGNLDFSDHKYKISFQDLYMQNGGTSLMPTMYCVNKGETVPESKPIFIQDMTGNFTLKIEKILRAALKKS